MNYVRTSPASKGKFKCYQCRCIISAKDGAWEDLKVQQIFVCKSCKFSPAMQEALATLKLTAV